MLVNGFLILVIAVVVIQASRVNDEFFQEVRDLLERKNQQEQQQPLEDSQSESNEVQSEVSHHRKKK